MISKYEKINFTWACLVTDKKFIRNSQIYGFLTCESVQWPKSFRIDNFQISVLHSFVENK